MSDRKKYYWEKKYDWDGPTLSSQKLIAWAFAIGARPRGHDHAALRRPHRGMLPDVDYGRAVADPEYRPLYRRVADLLRGGASRRKAGQPAQAELSAALATAVGESLAETYIGDDQAGDGAIRDADRNFDPTRWSRAA